MDERYRGVRIPTRATLAKYGLSLPAWKRLVRLQDGLCGVCRTIPLSGVLHIDHEHVPGWKRLPERERRKYVRGLLCYPCNKFGVGGVRGLAHAEAISQYLDRYDRRPR